MFKHWSWRLEGVTVKLTKVTREQRSGVKLALESLVIMNILNVGAKSIS